MDVKSYKELDKELKKIRKHKSSDPFLFQLETVKAIDLFYKNTPGEREMTLRFSKLADNLYKKDALYTPIVITVVFGFIITAVFPVLIQYADFDFINPVIELYDALTFPKDFPVFFGVLLNILAVWFSIFFAVTFVVALPVFPVELICFSRNKRFQREYEKTLLQKILMARIDYFKEEHTDEYESTAYIPVILRPFKNPNKVLLTFIMVICFLSSANYFTPIIMFFLGGLAVYLSTSKDDKMHKKK